MFNSFEQQVNKTFNDTINCLNLDLTAFGTNKQYKSSTASNICNHNIYNNMIEVFWY